MPNRRGDLEARCDFCAHVCWRLILDAQLHSLDAKRRKPRQPAAIGHDRIKAIEQRRPRRHALRSRSKNGVPATGVDGTAISRGGMMPASKPSAPSRNRRRERRRHAHRVARFRHRRIQQHRVKTDFHCLRRVRRRANAGINDQRHARENRRANFQAHGGSQCPDRCRSARPTA